MRDFFSIDTFTPWINPKSVDLTSVKLLSLLEITEKFPLIGQEFFDDLDSNMFKYEHYSRFKSIRRVIGPKKEDYKIEDWKFIWAMDVKDRLYQFLIQKVVKDGESQGIIVAMAPPELAQLFSEYKKDAIIKTLTLLNSSHKIKFLIYLTSKGKSIAEENKIFQIKESSLNEIKLKNYLEQIPNVNGQWFPNFSPKCPICGRKMNTLDGYRSGFIQLICPQCGYKQVK